MTDYGAYDEHKPCLNPNCASHGKPHPNCHCYPGLAHGGTVCEQMLFHGEGCKYFADGGTVEENSRFNSNPGLAVEHAAVNRGLLHLLTKAGHSKSENPHKPVQDFIDSSRQGRANLDSQMGKVIGPEKMDLEPNAEARGALKNHLDEIAADPLPLLNVGGSLRGQLPAQSAHLSALAGRAVSYLSGLRPSSSQGGPLDAVRPPGKIDEARYNRNLDVAHNPLLVLQHVKKNTVHPEDLTTLKALYPSLHQSMIEKATEQIIDARTKGIEISHKERQGLGKLLGQPLSITQSPVGMQAIIRANAGAQAPSQGKPPERRGIKGAVEQSDKQALLEATPLQARQLDRKS